MQYQFGLGRVSWLSSAKWDALLDNLTPLLASLAGAITDLTRISNLRPPQLGGNVSKRIRRDIFSTWQLGCVMQWWLLGDTQVVV